MKNNNVQGITYDNSRCFENEQSTTYESIFRKHPHNIILSGISGLCGYAEKIMDTIIGVHEAMARRRLDKPRHIRNALRISQRNHDMKYRSEANGGYTKDQSWHVLYKLTSIQFQNLSKIYATKHNFYCFIFNLEFCTNSLYLLRTKCIVLLKYITLKKNLLIQKYISRLENRVNKKS